MTRVIHIDELSRPADNSPLFSCQHLSLILLVTILYPSIHNKDTHYSLSKTPTIHYQNTHYSLLEQGTPPYLSLAINYHLKIMRFFLSHLTLLFSIQYTFRERRIIIHLKYFLQISNRLSSQSTGIGRGIGILPINISRHGNMAEKR